MDTRQMSVIDTNHQPDERILRLKCRCTCFSLKCLLWRMGRHLDSLMLCQNTKCLNMYSIFVLLSKELLSFLLFSKGNFLTWNLDSSFPSLLWGPGLIIITPLFTLTVKGEIITLFTLFFLDLQPPPPVPSNRNR